MEEREATPEVKRKRGRPTSTFSAKKRKQTERERRRSKTRISIGDETERWNDLKEEKGFIFNSEMAKFLLDSYENSQTQRIEVLISEQQLAQPSTSTPGGKSVEQRVVPISGPQLAQPSTSTPGGKPIEQRVVTRGLTDISEISSEEPASGSGMSGVLEISPQKTTKQTSRSRIPQSSRNTRSRASKEKSSSFVDPFDMILDVTIDDDEEEDDVDDESYWPSFDVTIRPKHMEELQDVSLADLEFGIEDSGDEEDEKEEEEGGGPGVFRIRDQQESYHLTKDVTCIVYMERLVALANTKVEYKCNRKNCKEQVAITNSKVGSAVYLTWKCAKEHIVHKWCSQPILNRGLHGGDLMCATAIIASGNNFAKLALWARFLNLHFLNSSTYVRIQNSYLQPTIEELWQQKQAELLRSLRNKDIVILGDGRMDSPGFCAQYCSYTAMDNATKKILTVVSMDKRQADVKCTNMEKIAFKRVLEELKKTVNVVEVVTDAHLGIGALMKKEFSTIKHSHDIWHAAKNLGKKITAAGTGKGCKPLMKWSSHITRHFWYCCQEANTYNEFVDIWGATLHHTVNEHEWAFSRCDHGHLEEGERDPEWLEKGSPAHNALRTIVYDKRFLNKVEYFLNFRSTAELENFHQLVLMYCAKRYSYVPPVYHARILMAALDYNENVDRAIKRNRDGSIRYQRNFNKKSGRWAVHPVKEDKTYKHVEELRESVVENRLADKVGMKKRVLLGPDDPRRVSKTIAPVPPPPTSELVEKQKSRLKRTSTTEGYDTPL